LRSEASQFSDENATCYTVLRMIRIHSGCHYLSTTWGSLPFHTSDQSSDKLQPWGYLNRRFLL